MKLPHFRKHGSVKKCTTGLTDSSPCPFLLNVWPRNISSIQASSIVPGTSQCSYMMLYDAICIYISLSIYLSIYLSQYLAALHCSIAASELQVSATKASAVPRPCPSSRPSAKCERRWKPWSGRPTSHRNFRPLPEWSLRRGHHWNNVILFSHANI